MTSNPEEPETAPTIASGAPKSKKRGHVGERARNIAPKKAKSGKQASSANKAAKPPKKAIGARNGSKTAKVLEMLRRADGATAQELLKATGWQAHSLRGFLSGTVRKKLGMTVTSTKSEDGERSYSVK